jgi:cytochrome c biogenesis protein CcmG/thiol:disulfide interchange protein DsbE
MKKVLAVSITIAVLIIVVFILNRELPQVTATVPGTDAKAAADSAIGVSDLVFKDLDGKELKLSDLRGKVILLDFWATWCEPCKIETPWLIELQRKYGPKGFTVVGIAMDEEGLKIVQPYTQSARFEMDDGSKLAINYPVVLGSPELGDKFGVTAFPTSVLISRDGKLVKITAGIDDGRDGIAKQIESQM